MITSNIRCDDCMFCSNAMTVEPCASCDGTSQFYPVCNNHVEHSDNVSRPKVLKFTLGDVTHTIETRLIKDFNDDEYTLYVDTQVYADGRLPSNLVILGMRHGNYTDKKPTLRDVSRWR